LAWVYRFRGSVRLTDQYFADKQVADQQIASYRLAAQQREAQQLNRELQRMHAKKNKRRISWGFGIWF